MQLVESIKMALYTIVSNKMRTALTILGIVIGIASVIAMVSIGQGNQKKMEKEWRGLCGPTVLFPHPCKATWFNGQWPLLLLSKSCHCCQHGNSIGKSNTKLTN